MEWVARRLVRQRLPYVIVGTIGVVLLVNGVATLRYGADTLRVAQYLPMGNQTISIGDVAITWAEVFVTALALVAVAGLYWMFRYARIGAAMRAVVDDPDLLALHGTNPNHVRRVAWIIGSTFSTASGVLLAPLIGVQAVALTFLVVAALGAVAIGGFRSIPLTYLGGVLIGIVTDVSQNLVVGVEWLIGLPASLPFVALVAVLLATPRRKLQALALPERRPPVQYRTPVRVRVVAGCLVVALFIALPWVAGRSVSYLTVGLTIAVMLYSLGLLVWESGQVSFAHVTFGAIGAVAFSQFNVLLGLPWFVAVLLGCLVVVPIAALVAIPAIRLSGVYLAVATLAFSIMVERLFYSAPFMFDTTGSGREMPRPDWAQSDRAYYYVVLGFVLVTAVVMMAIQRSRLGRMLRGMSDSQTAVSMMELNTSVSKIIVFCISGFFAGLGGILYGAAARFASYGGQKYTTFFAFLLFGVLVLAPLALPWYALFGVVATLIPSWIPGNHASSWENIIFGVFAVVVALQGGHPPMPPRLRAFFDRFARERPVEPERTPEPARPAVAHRAPVEREPAPGLEVRDLTVRFGGLVAVDRVSLDAPIGRITGLIGPNGAGKSTLFQACSGFVRPSEGRVLLKGEDVTRTAPATRGRRGLGRTFQVPQLCESLTVEENVALGLEAGMAGAGVISQVVAPRVQREQLAEAAAEAMQLCGIAHLGKLQAGALSVGQRRLVELARVLAGRFDMLLLDEPSSGLDNVETRAFGQVLLRVMEERRCGIVLVEHDMSLVTEVCSYIYVLNFGELLVEGDPATVLSSPAVRAAYLGGDTSVAEPREVLR